MFDFDLSEPVAIIGMGCHFPGANSYQEYWQNIKANKSFIEDLSIDSEVGQNYHADIQAWNRSSTKLCARVKPFEFSFQRFKGMTPHSINLGDFYIKYALAAAQDAIDDSGGHAFTNIRDKTFVAVGHYNYETKAVRHFSDVALQIFVEDLKATPSFLALSKNDQIATLKELEQNFFKTHEVLPQETIVSSMAPSVASRITKVNKFNGGFTSVDSACASSMAALDIAVRRLRDKSSAAAVVGGIGVVSPYFYVHCSKAHTMSTQGSFPFDKKASGFVVGEGSGFVVIKTLSEALKNKDRIHGVIRGVAGSSDGSKRGPWAPNKLGQAMAVHRALSQAQYGFDEVDYVECHGTGTQVGDREELACLVSLSEEAKSQKKRFIGSAKGAVGHLLPGAGMAGLLRVVMALKYHQFPPTAGVTNPIDELQDSPFEILTSIRDWPRSNPSKPRRAMVNCFGFGGTNYNLQVEEYVESFHADYLAASSQNFRKNLRQNRSIDILSSDNYNIPIAVVGLGIKLPGSNNIHEFHQNNLLGNTCFQKIPENRYKEKYCKGFEAIAGKKAAESLGGYVDLPSEESKLNWKISPAEIKDVDPNQFRLFEVVKQALQDARLIERKDLLEKTAMICGVMIDSDFFGTEHMSVRMNALLDYMRKNLAHIEKSQKEKLIEEFFLSVRDDLYEQSKDSAIAGIDSMLGSRVAKFFDLKGGSLSLDAVCATGIISLDHACRLLKSKELDAVVVCSSNMGMNAQLKQCYDQMTGGWLNEASKPFDKDRKGFLLGEGAVCFVLRRMDDAVNENQNIHALIRATGISSDGASNQMLQPHFATTKLAFENTLHQAVKKIPVEMVECHGIGTIASDQTEMELVREIYSPLLNKPIGLGALKGSIGHLKVCSAFASVAKSVLSVKNNVKYPIANFTTPDDYLIQNKNTLQVYDQPTPYESSEKFCGVTAIGLGGINGHLVLSNYDPKLHIFKNESSKQSTSVISKKNAQAILVSGSAEERGAILGRLWATSFNQNYDHVWERLPKQLFGQKEDILNTFNKWLPESYKKELVGLAHGAEVSEDVVLMANCLTMAVTTQYGMCFGFAKNGLHGSNYDFPFVTKNDNSLLPREVFEFHSPDCIPFTGVFLLGSPFPYCGANAKGISVSASSGTALGRISDGIFVYALVRKILEKCSSLAEVNALVQTYKVSGSWIFIVQSGEENSSIQIEMSEEKIQFKEAALVEATNHFQYLDDGLKRREDSEIRLQRLKELTKALGNESSEAFAILGDRYDVARNKVTKFSTSNTLNRYNSAVSFLYDHKEKQMSVSCRVIPSGDGQYEVFHVPQVKKTGLNEIICAQTSIGEKIFWRDSWIQNLGVEDVLLLSKKQVSLRKRFSNLRCLFVEDQNVEITTAKINLIDVTNIEYLQADLTEVFTDFEVKSRLIKDLISKTKIQDIVHIGSNKKMARALNVMSKPFYRTLLQEKICENFYQIDISRDEDAIWCLEKIFEEQRFSAHDVMCFNKQLYTKVYGFVDNKFHNFFSIGEDEKILFTGGLSGIGFECLKKIVTAFPKARFIIFGRSDVNKKNENLIQSEFIKRVSTEKPGLKPKEYQYQWEVLQRCLTAKRNLDSLQKISNNIFYYKVDLANTQQTEAVLKQVSLEHGPVHHLVHSAGIEKSKLFKDSTDFNHDVFDIKTIHTVKFFELLKSQELKNIVLFGSVAGEFGNEGQSEYSAANGFYSYLVDYLRQLFKSASIKNIQWPGWDDVGMAAKPAVKPALLQKGYKLISPAVGAEIFFEFFISQHSFSEMMLTHVDENLISFQFAESRKYFLQKKFAEQDFQLVDSVLFAFEDYFVTEKVFTGSEDFLRDHFIKNQMAVPGVFWVEMLMESSLCIGWNRNKKIILEKVEFIELCSLSGNYSRAVRMHVRKNQNEWSFTVVSNKKNSLGDILAIDVVHAKGTFKLSDSMEEVDFPATHAEAQESGVELYQMLNSSFSGRIGPSFHKIKSFTFNSNQIFLKLETIPESPWGFVFDTINQAIVLWGQCEGRFDYLPYSLQKVWICVESNKSSLFNVVINRKNILQDSLQEKICFSAVIYDAVTNKCVANFKHVEHKKFGMTLINKEIL